MSHQKLLAPRRGREKINSCSVFCRPSGRSLPAIISLEAHLGLAEGKGPSGERCLCIVLEVISLVFTAPRAPSGQSRPRKSEAEEGHLEGFALEWPGAALVTETTSGCTQSLKRQRSIPRSREPSRQLCALEQSGRMAATAGLERRGRAHQCQECHCEVSLKKDKLPTMTTGTLLTWGWGR